MTCDKCHAPAEAARTCGDCGKTYYRCARHGGDAGCKRSLHSHKAVYHPRELRIPDAAD